MGMEGFDKGEVDLCMVWADFFGCIVPDDESPAVYTNQVGGLSCHHPEVRGIYVPIPNQFYNWEDDLFRGTEFVYSHNDYEPDKVQQWLDNMGDISKVFEPRDGDCEDPIREAWVPVRIAFDDESDDNPKSQLWHLSAFEGRNAFLTYPNSD